MALRPIHNRIARIVTGYDSKVIDRVNREIDAPSQTHPGMQHRQWYHSRDPLRKDSMRIHRGDPRKMVLQHIHIMVDEDPHFKRFAKIMQMEREIKGLKNGKNRRKH